MGVRVTLVGSGARKLDGQSESVTTDEAVAVAQARVLAMAEVFFEHVSVFRPQLTVDALRALQGGVSFGSGAVALGLADRVGSMNDALAIAAGAKTASLMPSSTPTEDAPMASMTEAIEALRAAADGDDKEEAARASRMLAAMDEPEEEAKAEGDEEKEEEETAKAIAMRALGLAQATARDSLLATRPDISAALRATLAKSSTPLDTVRSVLAATPRVSRAAQPAAAATPMRGEGQATPPTADARFAAANLVLGIKDSPSGIVRSDKATSYHTMTPTQARQTFGGSQ